MAPITFDREDFVTALEHAVAHSSTDETRPHLCCVQVRVKGSLAQFVATDGHRLLVYGIGCSGKDDERVPGAEVLVSRADAETMLAAFSAGSGKSRVRLDAEALIFRAGRAAVDLEAVDGTFPPYEKVIPKLEREPSQGVRVNAQYLAAAFAACASCYERGSTPTVAVNVGGALDPVRFDVETRESPLGRSCSVVVMPIRPT